MGRVVVDIADLKVSKQADDTIVTYALGSCIGLVLWDPVAKVGGLLHAMLPQSSTDPEKAQQNPAMFVDTGVPQLFRDCYAKGAQKERLQVRLYGGACTSDPANDMFQIGKRNVVMVRKLLWKNGVLLTEEDVAGTASRTVSLEIGTGQVTVRSTERSEKAVPR